MKNIDRSFIGNLPEKTTSSNIKKKNYNVCEYQYSVPVFNRFTVLLENKEMESSIDYKIFSTINISNFSHENQQDCCLKYLKAKNNRKISTSMKDTSIYKN